MESQSFGNVAGDLTIQPSKMLRFHGDAQLQRHRRRAAGLHDRRDPGHPATRGERRHALPSYAPGGHPVLRADPGHLQPGQRAAVEPGHQLSPGAATVELWRNLVDRPREDELGHQDRPASSRVASALDFRFDCWALSLDYIRRAPDRPGKNPDNEFRFSLNLLGLGNVLSTRVGAGGRTRTRGSNDSVHRPDPPARGAPSGAARRLRARDRLEPVRARPRGQGARAGAGGALRRALGARRRLRHGRAAPDPERARRRARTRGHHAGVLVRRVSDHDHDDRRHAGLRRYRSGDVHARSRGHRARDHTADARDHARPSLRPAGADGPRARAGPRPSAGRGRGRGSGRRRRVGRSSPSGPGAMPRACRSIRPRISGRAATAAWW